jgi:hypothetical protein
MKITSIIAISSLLLTLTLTSCFSLHTNRTTPDSTTIYSSQTRSTPYTTTTTRSTSY